MLEVANLEVVYNDVVAVLRGLSLEVPDGQIVALLGANGAGKTTTVRAICGLLGLHEGEITKGTVTFDGGVISGNSAAEMGGGIYCYINSHPTIVNNIIADNSARIGAGIVCRLDSFPTITNNTVYGNHASSSGGGLYWVSSGSPGRSR